MTAVADRSVAPPAAARRATGGAGSPSAAKPVPQYHIPAEAALAALTLATVFGFSRVFDSASFWGPLFLVTAYAHVSLIALRRNGVGILVSAGLGTLGLAVTLVYTFFTPTLGYGLPSGRTLDAIGSAMAQSWQTFQNVQPPAPVETGFLIASGVAIFFAVFLADWAAFRLWSGWEAIVPATTVFVFCSVLGGTERRTESVTAFTSAAVAFILLHRIARRETSAGWLSSDARRGANSWLRVGAILGASGVILGVVAAPRLPGADRGAIFGRDSKQGKGDRFTVSPLVEIKGRMVDQANVEMFTVRADREAYWRLTALDLFDGSTWRSRGKFVAAEGDLKPALGAAKRERLSQQYEISSLARLWLPAAYQVQKVSASARANYHDESGTLIVDTAADTSDGSSYTVESLLPQLDPAELRKADPKLTDATLRRHYTTLPSSWSVQAPGMARDIVTKAKATTEYDQARALQDFFQDAANNFKYDLKAAPGQSGSAIDEFLTKRVGYCEQYSASFAAMARSLDLPARVAVGFTWGQRDANDPKLYHVKGEHAHAWPEVYLGQYGWVSFEPTPTRGQPGAAAWTGREPAQFEDVTDATRVTNTTRNTIANGTIVGGGSTSTSPAPGGLATDTSTTTLPMQGTGTESGGGFGAVIRLALTGLLLALGLAAIVGIYAAMVMSWLGRERRKRRALAQSPADFVRVSWADAIDHLSMIGALPDRAETHGEFAARAGRLLPAGEAAIHDLALDTDAATYAEHLLDAATADHAADAAVAVRRAVDVKVPPGRQWLTRLNPAWVFRRTRLPKTHRATATG